MTQKQLRIDSLDRVVQVVEATLNATLGRDKTPGDFNRNRKIFVAFRPCDSNNDGQDGSMRRLAEYTLDLTPEPEMRFAVQPLKSRVIIAFFVAAAVACSAESVSASIVVSVPVFINEIHYDNIGTDTGEFIEIAGPAGTNLSGWSLVRYNGAVSSSAVTYASPTGPTLSGVIPNQSNGFGTLAFSFPVDGLQNGSNDGIALVNAASIVIQLLSYEGVFTASNGPAAGMTSVDIGVDEDPPYPAGSSLQLVGTGTVYSDFTWVDPPASPGLININQTFRTAAAVPEPLSAIVWAGVGAASAGLVWMRGEKRGRSI